MFLQKFQLAILGADQIFKWIYNDGFFYVETS